MLFAQTPWATVPELRNLGDESWLRGLDETSALSLNGCRTAEAVLEAVPNPFAFRLTLRFIKHWATQRGIYGNVYGYLNGVAWSILTARTCQLFPNACGATLVEQFFKVVARYLQCGKTVTIAPVVVDGPLGCRFPQLDRPHQTRNRAQILTPQYPPINCCGNVGSSTLGLIVRELDRAQRLMRETPQEARDESFWQLLSRETDFFERYRSYIEIAFSAQNSAAISSLEGMVESRIRRLVDALEETPGVASAEPLPRVLKEAEEYAVGGETQTSTVKRRIFVGLTFDPTKATENGQPASAKVSIDITPAVVLFRSCMTEWLREHASEEYRIETNVLKRTEIRKRLKLSNFRAQPSSHSSTPSWPTSLKKPRVDTPR